MYPLFPMMQPTPHGRFTKCWFSRLIKTHGTDTRTPLDSCESGRRRRRYLAVFGRTGVQIALALAVDLLHFGLMKRRSSRVR